MTAHPRAPRIRERTRAPFRCAFVLLVAFAPTRYIAADPWTRHTIDALDPATGKRGADGVRLADADGDGRLDIVTGWEEGGAIRVCLQPERSRVRAPWPAVTVGRVRSPEDAVFVDLDGDGALDVVSSCEGRCRTVYAHWAPRAKERYLEEDAWKTVAFPVTEKKERWMFALPAQIDGRYGVDLFVGSKGARAELPGGGSDFTGGSVGWLEAPEDPRDLGTWRYHKLREAGWIMSLRAGDLDRDGDDDLLLSDRYGSRRGVFWLENPGAVAAREGAPWREHTIGGTDLEVMFLVEKDLDGDGLEDILTTTRGGVLLAHRRLERTAPRYALERIPLPYGLEHGKSLAVADVDLDGRLDLVTTNRGKPGSPSVAWLERQGDTLAGPWTAHDISGPEGNKFDLIESLDLDGDGDLDLITCEERDGLGVVWYENTTR